MKAARIVEPMRIEIVEAQKPEVKEGQFLVKSKTVSICGSDTPFFLRERHINYPLEPGVPGHECIGFIAESRCNEYKEGDAVLSLPIGDRGFAEYFIGVPDRTVRLPEGDTSDKLVVAQPLGTIVHACRKLFHPLLYPFGIEKGPLNVDAWKLPDTKVGIIGQGSIGLLFTAMMKNMEVNPLIVIDMLDYRLEAAKKLGATHVINMAKTDSVSAVREITSGAMLDLVIEAVGKDTTINDCFALARRSATVLAFGVPRLSVYDFMFPEFFGKELKLIGSLGPEIHIDFPPAVDMVANGKVDVSHVITHRLPFDEIQKAFDLVVGRQDGAIKVLLEI